jgi:hypothetical protein
MIDKGHLCNKPVVFRLRDHDAVYSGKVVSVESDGFWIESPGLIGQMKEDVAWNAQAGTIPSPVIFVPIPSLVYLIAENE